LGLTIWAVGGLAWAGSVVGGGYREALGRVAAAPLDWLLVAAEIWALAAILEMGLGSIGLPRTLPVVLTTYLSYVLSGIPIMLLGVAWGMVGPTCRD